MRSSPTPKIPDVNADASEGPRTVGGKALPAEIYLIDRAALELRVKRGPFLVQAAVEKARTVLAAKAVIEDMDPAA